jgi:hypothetical protein
MKNTVIFISLIVLLTSLLSCNNPTQPRPKNNGLLTLSLVDTSCTEAWIDLKAQNITTPAEINLLLDDNALTNISLTTNDTVIYIDSLLPQKSYTLEARYTNNNGTASSNKLNIATLDTTSNNFSFSTFTFGDPSVGSSLLLDCADISANDIWCVGEINIADTSINGYTTYNAVHWDGSKWKLSQISFPQYNYDCTVAFYAAGDINSVFAFSSNDVLFTDGLSIARWNGNLFVNYPCLSLSVIGNGRLKKIWGASENNFYCVGSEGTIFQYQNSQWIMIGSGTTTDINDIWGVNDSTANNSLVLCAVSSRYELGDYKLLSISGNTVQEYINWPYTRLYGIWFNSPRKIYIVGDRGYLYVNNKLSRMDLPANAFLTRVKGTGLNDIYIAGEYNTLLHFNGVRWQTLQGINGNYEGLDVKGNTVVLVGYNVVGGMVGNAVVTMVKHNN